METTAAMEASAVSMEFATTVKPSIAMELMALAKCTFAVELATSPTIVIAPATMIPVAAEAAPSPTIMIPVAAPAATVITAAIPAMIPIRVIPRAYANEHAVCKPFRAVETIRRARIRIVVVIPVSTNRRWTYISRAIIAGAHAHADEHSLRARKGRAKQANAK